MIEQHQNHYNHHQHQQLFQICVGSILVTWATLIFFDLQFSHRSTFFVFSHLRNLLKKKKSFDLITNILNDAIKRDENEIEIFESLEDEFTITDTLLYCCRCRNIKHLNIEQEKKQLVLFIDDISDLLKLEVHIENGNGIHIKPRAHKLDDLFLLDDGLADKNVLKVFVDILNNVLLLKLLHVRINTLDVWNEQIMPLLKEKHLEDLLEVFNSAKKSKKNILKLMNMDELKRVDINPLDNITKLHVHLENLKILKKVSIRDYGQVSTSTVTKQNVRRKSMVKSKIYHTFAPNVLFIYGIPRTPKIQHIDGMEKESETFVSIFDYGKDETLDTNEI